MWYPDVYKCHFFFFIHRILLVWLKIGGACNGWFLWPPPYATSPQISLEGWDIPFSFFFFPLYVCSWIHITFFIYYLHQNLSELWLEEVKQTMSQAPGRLAGEDEGMAPDLQNQALAKETEQEARFLCQRCCQPLKVGQWSCLEVCDLPVGIVGTV